MTTKRQVTVYRHKILETRFWRPRTVSRKSFLQFKKTIQRRVEAVAGLLPYIRSEIDGCTNENRADGNGLLSRRIVSHRWCSVSLFREGILLLEPERG